MHRFFSETAIETTGCRVILSPEESRHALQVLRLQPGDEVQVFDGKGLWAARLETPQNAKAVLLIGEALPSPEACCRVTLWQGLPKADKMEWIVQKATELGVSSIWPVEMERSVAHAPASGQAAKKLDRLQKIALEAAKQSARACAPEIRETLSFREALAAAEKFSFSQILVAWEEEHALLLSQAIRETAKTGLPLDTLLLVIGPEGGISPQEYAQLQALGAKAVSLGKRILRTETAGLCALSVLWAALGEM